MRKDGVIEHYDDGERACPICDVALPAHSTWPGTRYRFCGGTECASEVRKLTLGRYVDAGTEPCQAPGCPNLIPEGLYNAKCKFIACSSDCYNKRAAQGSILMKCACPCGQTFLRASNRPTKSGLVFMSPRHRGNYVIDQHLQESCGRFRPIADEYITGIARIHYTDTRNARIAVSTLLLFLTQSEISSLEDVSPRTITEYIRWMGNTNRKIGTDTLSCISTFFNWMIDEGRRKVANPVTRWHRQPRPKRNPRPLTQSELIFMWNLLNERGTPQIRLATAFGIESGLRISEMGRVRLSDVDLERWRLLVRLPNKGRREEFVFFGPKTIEYWHEWMKVRDPNCGHNCVLYNEIGKPYSSKSLRAAFKRILCKEVDGKRIHEVGFDKWSTHRLRHTMATALVAAGADLATTKVAGRWLNEDAMAAYIAVSEEQAQRGYDEAMRKFYDQKDLAPQTRPVSPDELLAIWAAEEEGEAQDGETVDQQRCV